MEQEREASGEDRVVDVAVRKTESEWAYTAQKFFEKLAPLWFKWISWIFVLGGIAFLAQRTDSLALRIIERISYAVLFFYYLYFFSSIRIEPYHSWANNQKSGFRRVFATTFFHLDDSLGNYIIDTLHHLSDSDK